MTEEFRRSTLQKIRDHPNSQILFELIFKRLQFEDLALIAPIVLEKTDDGNGAQIIHKRIDLRNSRKILEKKTTIEFSTDNPLVRFSPSYLVTNNESKPKGFECENSEDDLLFFKINRENTAPKLELAHPWFLTKDNLYTSSEMISMCLHLQTSQGMETIPDGIQTWCVSDIDLKLLDYNISRQRSWRNVTANPQRNIHPILKVNRDLEKKEKSLPMTIDFVNFSSGESKLVWAFNFVLTEPYNLASDYGMRFLDDSFWLLLIDVYDEEGNDKILFFNLEKKEVKSYQLPYPFIAASAFYGFYESSLYYLSEADEEDKYLVFGYFYQEEKLNEDPDNWERDPDCLKHLCFFERGELTKKSGLKIGIKGLMHLVLDQYETESKVFTIKIDEIKKLLLAADELTCELSFPGQRHDDDVPAKATLPLIKLDELYITKYEDLSENLDPEQSDIGYMDGNKLHLLV